MQQDCFQEETKFVDLSQHFLKHKVLSSSETLPVLRNGAYKKQTDKHLTTDKYSESYWDVPNKQHQRAIDRIIKEIKDDWKYCKPSMQNQKLIQYSYSFSQMVEIYAAKDNSKCLLLREIFNSLKGIMNVSTAIPFTKSSKKKYYPMYLVYWAQLFFKMIKENNKNKSLVLSHQSFKNIRWHMEKLLHIENAEIFVTYGQILMAANEGQKAYKMLNKAVQLGLKAMAYYHIAEGYAHGVFKLHGQKSQQFKTENIRQAVKYYELSIKEGFHIYPEDQQFYYSLGQKLKKQKQSIHQHILSSQNIEHYCKNLAFYLTLKMKEAKNQNIKLSNHQFSSIQSNLSKESLKTLEPLYEDTIFYVVSSAILGFKERIVLVTDQFQTVQIIVLKRWMHINSYKLKLLHRPGTKIILSQFRIKTCKQIEFYLCENPKSLQIQSSSQQKQMPIQKLTACVEYLSQTNRKQQLQIIQKYLAHKLQTKELKQTEEREYKQWLESKEWEKYVRQQNIYFALKGKEQVLKTLNKQILEKKQVQSQLVNKCKQIQTIISDKQDKISKLIQKQEELQKQISKKNGQKQQSQKKMQDLLTLKKNLLQKMQQQISEKTKKINEKKKIFQQMQKSYNKLKQQFQTSDEKMKKIRMKNRQLLLQQQLNDEKAKKTAKQLRIIQIKKQNYQNQLRINLCSISEAIQDAKKELSELLEKIGKGKKQKQTIAIDIKQLNTKLIDLKQQVRQFFKEKKLIENDIQGMKKQRQFENQEIEERGKIIKLHKQMLCNMTEKNPCCVCLDSPVTHINIACGHLSMCGKCVNEIEDICPLCKAQGKHIKVYLPTNLS